MNYNKSDYNKPSFTDSKDSKETLPMAPGDFNGPVESLELGDEIQADFPVVKIEYLAKSDSSVNFKKGLLTIGGAEQAEEIIFTPVAAKYIGNVMYPEKFDPDSKALCFSNGSVPIGGTNKESIDCATCGKSEMDWFRVHGEKPPCAKVTALLGYDWTRNFPFLMRLKRAAKSKAFRRFVNTLRSRVLNAHPGMQVNWCYKCKLSVEPEKTYYMPVFEIIDKLSIDDAGIIAQVFTECSPILDKITTGEELEDSANSTNIMSDEKEVKDSSSSNEINEDESGHTEKEVIEDDLPF